MKITVYQLHVDSRVKKENRVCTFRTIGTVRGRISNKIFPEEAIWELTNHFCWTGREKSGITRDGKVKYYPTKHNRGVTNDDICFRIGHFWYCAKSVGWKLVNTKEEAMKYLWEHSYRIRGSLPENYKFENIKK